MPIQRLNLTKQIVAVTIELAAADVDRHVMAVPAITPTIGNIIQGLLLVAVGEIHVAAGGASAALQIRRCRAQAPAAGTACLSATLDLTASVDVMRAGALVVSEDDRYFRGGDSVGFDYAGTLTALNGTVTLYFERVSS